MSVRKFQIESFVGALPLRFGMTPNEVIGTIGAPDHQGLNYFGNLTLHYHSKRLDLNIGFDKSSGLATHFGFGKRSSVTYRDHDFFGDPQAWRRVVHLSSDCHEWVGIIILADLGITLSGFHDSDSSQLAVCVFREGDYDPDRSKFKPFILP